MATPIPTRIFDLLSRQRSLFPQKACLLVEEEGAWRSYSTDEVMTLVRQLAAGLLRAGLSYGDGTAEGRSKVAIISRNRPEWIITDLAVQRAGGVVVPVYPTLHEDELLYILEHASVQYVFTDEADLFRLIRDRRGVLPQLKDIFSFLPLPGARSWKELLVEAGAGEAALLEESNQRITGTDLATIVYTSGTTGTPKGVMLSHSNILHNIMSCYQLLPAVLKPGSPVLSFLPLSHAFERAANYLYLYAGQQIHFTGMATIGQDIKRVAPVMFTTVPRLLEKVYEAIQLKGGKLTGWKKKLFDLSIRLAEAYDPHASPSLTVKLQLALVDRLVYRQWRAALGGQVKAIITGAAPCPVKLLRVFSAAGIVIMEGYGMTEASPVVAANRYEPGGRRFGTVGLPLDGVQLRLAGDGEVLVQGPNVMMGYYKRPDLTAEAIQEGWLHTGDIGSLEEGRFLRLTDRKKELFKTSGGKYVAPSPIENRLTEHPLVEQVLVTGEGRKFVSAFIVPSFSHLESWFRTQRKSYPGPDHAVRDPDVQQLFRQLVDAANSFSGQVEQVKKFTLLPRSWTVESGELTPTLKPRRRVILGRLQQALEAMYD